MAEIEIKKARVFPSGKQFFPITHTKAVINEDGANLEQELLKYQKSGDYYSE